MKFNELRLAEPIVRAVTAEGYTTPTPIQQKAIPEAIEGRDLLGCAQTGTGKTGAFALPILHRLAASMSDSVATNGPATTSDGPKKGRNRNRRGRKPNQSRGDGRLPRALVLAPTRELATQIYESFCTYGSHLPLRHTVVFGGVGQTPQVRALQNGVDVLVATPGRLLDLIEQGFIKLQAIEVLVLDEADRMLDMGFIHDIRKVVKLIPKKRQTLFFSATMPPEIRRLADALLKQPVFIEVAPVSSTADSIDQSVYMVTKKNKPLLIQRLFKQHDMDRTLVFTRTKYGADKLVKVLRRGGVEAAAIHGNKTQTARTRALDRFKSGSVAVLVATDIASRGIDVDEISHVINYEIPNIPETYVHRIGRTARAGASGIAISFCDSEELSYLRAIERLIQKQLPVVDEEQDLCFDTSTLPPPKPANGGGQGRTKQPSKQPRRKARRQPRNRQEQRTKDSGAQPPRRRRRRRSGGKSGQSTAAR